MKKYVITLQDIKDKEEFCDQMEKSLTGFSKGFIPQRSCDCVIKGKMGRSATYILSEEEAANIKNDARIKNVELSFEHIPGLKIAPTIFKPKHKYKMRGSEDNFQDDFQDDFNFSAHAVGDKYASISNVPTVINEDVVIVDDMIDTAGTLCTAASNLKANGARRVFAFASHGLFSGPASDRISRSALEEVVVTNTIPLKASAKANEKIVQLSVIFFLYIQYLP